MTVLDNTFFFQILVYDVVLFRLRADILSGRHTIQVDLMEDGALRTHPGVLGVLNAVVEDWRGRKTIEKENRLTGRSLLNDRIDDRSIIV